MKTPKIIEGKTSNYELFQFFKENRKMKTQSHINALIGSIKRFGVLRKVIVVKNSGLFYIIDGQHLFVALKALKLPIPYFEVDIQNNKDVVDLMSALNNINKGWSMFDYARLFSFAGRNTYTKLLEKYSEFNCALSFGVIVHIYTGNIYTKAYKEGTSKLRNLNDANRLAKQILEINTLVTERISHGHTLHRIANAIEHQSYVHSKFIKNLEQWLKHNKGLLPHRKLEVIDWVNEVIA